MTIQQKPISDMEIYFAYFSVYIIFPLLYNMLVCGDKSVIMVLWRYITSGVFDTVSYIKELATDLFYTALRTFGRYSFSTYTVVKDGREIYTSSSMFYYYKSDEVSVYRIDQAKYNVCKWIDQQCKLYLKLHGEEPEVNAARNDIYDFILHKVDRQPYTRIHRGDFTGRTHTLITEHYRPYRKSYQFAPEAELTVYANGTSVEPPLVSTETTIVHDHEHDDAAHSCFQPQVFKLNLKTPRHFFLEKNEILDTVFLKWLLYNEFGRDGIAKYLHSPFYNYKLTLYYNECMKDYFKEDNKTVAETENQEPRITNTQPTRFPAYVLDHTQSVIIGHTYVVKIDSLLRCPVFESNEKQVFDIDGVLSSYYDNSDTECDDDGDADAGTDSDSDSDSDSDTDTDTDSDTETATATATTTTTDPETKTVTSTQYDEAEFEVIQ